MDDTKIAQISCAAVVANLEGFRNMPLTKNPIAKSSLTELEARVRVLETKANFALPPPSIEFTWEALAWRIWRLDSQNRRSFTSTIISFGLPAEDAVAANGLSKEGGTSTTGMGLYMNMVPNAANVSIDTLQRLSSDIYINSRFSGMFRPQDVTAPVWPKTANDEEMLDLIRQRMFHSAGTRKIVFSRVPVERVEVYAALVQLHLELDASRAPPRPSWAPLPPGVSGRRKPCCGCCSCTCHKSNHQNDSDSDSDSDDDDESVRRPALWRRWSRACFRPFRVLACWRQSKMDDGSSTTSTRSSSTRVD